MKVLSLVPIDKMYQRNEYVPFSTPRFELIGAEDRIAAMTRFVAEQSVAPGGEHGGGLERGDLVRPTGAVLMFIHSDDPADKTGPKIEASFEVTQGFDLEGQRERRLAPLSNQDW